MDLSKESRGFLTRVQRVKVVEAPYELGEKAQLEVLKKAAKNAKIIRYTICFNHPAFCPECKDIGGKCITTVALTKAPPIIAVDLSSEEIHSVEKHKGALSEGKLKYLRKIFQR